MKRLILVGGPMGVGKSAVCRALLERLQPGIHLDGDWCWNMRPFSVTEETKALVLDNICWVLARDLACPQLEYVIFSWVLHRQEILDGILSRLPLDGVDVVSVSLLASPEQLRLRLERDMAQGRRPRDGVVERSLAYLPLYQQLDTWKLDTTGVAPVETAEQICSRLSKDGRKSNLWPNMR